MKKKLLIGVLLVIACLAYFILGGRKSSAPGNSSTPPNGQSSSSTTTPKDNFNKQTHPIDKAGSIWWIVSKVRPLEPLNYAPDDLVTPVVPLRANANSSEMRLREEPAAALRAMVADAKKAGISLILVSGYRSYQLQVSVYNGYVQQYGQAGADKQSARPGTSEHQTGLAADLGAANGKCELEQCFADTSEGHWIADNAYNYGFILRYVSGKDAVTGYEYEPWHVRYVGKDLSMEMHKENIQTLEEFFGVVPASQPY
ncbi:MAG TPA: M15 family metallopeptidase [Patescibacteria group bacterium]|nr:M15 family metallopeptidase [Patescibacteria group bacterium]